MPVPARRLASGMIWVDVVPRDDGGRAVVYARVSSHDQRAGLDRQVARLARPATGRGLTVGEGGGGGGAGVDGPGGRGRGRSCGPPRPRGVAGGTVPARRG